MSKKRITAVILAAGCGSRMGSDITKQRMTVFGKTLLYRSVAAFERSSLVDDIVVVCRADEENFALSQTKDLKKVRAIIHGGNTRAESAAIAARFIEDDSGIIMIHDAARCLVLPEDISKVATSALKTGAATAAYPVTDTVKLLGKSGNITSTTDRSRLLIAQTPQAFDLSLYKRAIDICPSDVNVTDDNMLIERMGIEVTPVMTSKYNIKITTPEDIAYAEFVIGRNTDKYE